jgi:hypothetical protein
LDSHIQSDSGGLPAEAPAAVDCCRFGDGPWTGWWTQPGRPGRHWMTLTLAFAGGIVSGNGHDAVGPFMVNGSYHTIDGTCVLSKSYGGGVGCHSVLYEGRWSGRVAAAVAGVWRLQSVTGRFCMWPVEGDK